MSYMNKPQVVIVMNKANDPIANVLYDLSIADIAKSHGDQDQGCC